MIFCNKN